MGFYPQFTQKDTEIRKSTLISHCKFFCGGPSRTRTGDLWLVKPLIQSGLTEPQWARFREQVYNKYAKSCASVMISYAKRYESYLSNVSAIESIPPTTRNNAIKSLIVLSKFLGITEEFKGALKSYGIKLSRPDALSAFTRIYNNNNASIDDWITKVKPNLRPEENLLLRFVKLTGLRASEGIASYNLIIQLSRESKLSTYFNSEVGVLEHFRFKAQFLRGTKNCYISIVPESLITEITSSQLVTYTALLKRLQRRKMGCRISELRDYYGTFMTRHGLCVQEADLLCGRIPPSIFVRHYFSPAIAELRARTLKALGEMESI
jgi:intergrase/recombinase